MEIVVETCEWGGRTWRRYPNSPRRSHRVYFQSHASWKQTPLYLHREIWKAAHGQIPEGCDIHHIDENPLNNSLENLECVTVREHRSRHREAYRSEKQLAHLRRIRDVSLAGLARWKASPEGVAVLREQGRRVMEARPLADLVCQECGSAFRSKRADAMYCKTSCQQRAWRKQAPKKVRICEECSCAFLTVDGDVRFCGKSCAGRARERLKRNCV